MRAEACVGVLAVRHSIGMTKLACEWWSCCTHVTAFDCVVCVLQLLQYHVVPNVTLTTAEITNGQTLTTALSGQTLKVCCPS